MRRLVLLFDGTWSQPATDTNVERLRRLLAPRDASGAGQWIRYIRGVGVKPGITHWLGGLFGLGFSGDVLDGYRWLCDTWREGDLVYIFGYSRGAYSARSIAGLIDTCGLLARRGGANVGRAAVKAAYACYRHAPDGRANAAARAFRARHSIPIAIEFIGVWETVGQLGIPSIAAWLPYARARYCLHDTQPSRCVRHAFQALALDEHRADFCPTLWTRNAAEAAPETEIEQRWFIGSHADVGGGYLADGAGRSPDPLPVLPLAWLQSKAMACGLAFTAAVQPAATAFEGVPNDSYRQFLLGLYRWFRRPVDRTFGTAINETLDGSVRLRWWTDPTYRPATLVDALAAGRAALPGSDAAGTAR